MIASKSEAEWVTCPACHGAGGKREFNYYKYALNPGRVAWVDCGKCGGRGKVKISAEKKPE